MTIYKITKRGNYGVIGPIPGGKLAGMLLQKMSYTRKGAEYMPHPEWAVVKLYSVKKGVFPWGFANVVDDVMRQWGEYSPDDKYIWEYTIPSVEHWHTPKLRQYQNDAIDALIEHRGGILCMPTGSGKTITALRYIKILNRTATVVVPTLDIKKMWESKLGENDDVRIINYQNPRAATFVATSDIIIFDECHHVAAKSLYNLSMFAKTDSIIVGLSASPVREDGEDMRMFGALGPIVYQISRRDLIEQWYLSDAVVHYYKPLFDTQGDFVYNYVELYDKHIVKNFSRNKMILDAMAQYVAKGRKVLVLVTQIEHGQYLYDASGIEKKIFCHGQSLDRYKNLSEYNCIVASNIFNEGIDLPELDVVILAAGGKSSIQLTQRVGRVLRLKASRHAAIIIDFVDLGPKHLSKHYKRRRELLSQDFEVVEHEQSGATLPSFFG